MPEEYTVDKSFYMDSIHEKNNIDTLSYSVIETKICCMIQKYLPDIMSQQLHSDSGFMDICLDSLSYFNLILDIEKVFNIEFDEDKINFRAFTSVSDISSYVKNKIERVEIV